MSDESAEAQADRIGREAAALTGALLRLASALKAARVHEAADLLDDYWDLLRPMTVARALGEGSFIAVAGPQGVGKTSVVGSLYGLDDWLVDNEGQGELSPVFIVEDDVPEPRGYLIRIDQAAGQDLSGAEVTAEEFRRNLRGEGRELLYPELRVPRELFSYAPGEKGVRRGLLLLPGYERLSGTEPESNRLWQLLMREALSGASAVILVTRVTNLARSGPAAVMAEIREQYLRRSPPLVVVNGDHPPDSDPDAVRGYRKTAAETLGCTEQEVVYVWRRGLTFEVGELAERLRSTELVAPIAAPQRWKSLGERADRPLIELLSRTSTLLDALDYEAGRKAERTKLAPVLEPFDESVREIRRAFIAGLDQIEEQVLDEALRRADKLLDKNDSSIFDMTIEQVLKEKAMPRPAAKATARRRLLRRAWHGEDATQPSRIAMAVPGLFDRVIGARLTIAGVPGLLTGIGSGPPGTGVKVSSGREQATATAIEHLLAGTADRTVEVRESMKEAARLLPALALQWASYAASAPEIVSLNRNTMEPVEPSPGDLLRTFTASVGAFTDAQQKVVESIARIAGIREEGEQIKDLSGLLRSLKDGRAAATLVSSTTRLAGGIAALSLLYGVYDLTYARRKRDREEVRSALRAVSARDRELRVAAFDDLMDHTRQVVAAATRRHYGLDTAYGDVDAIRRAVATVEGGQRRFLEALGDGGVFLG